MVQSADGTPPRVEPGVKEVLPGVDRGSTARVNVTSAKSAVGKQRLLAHGAR